MNKGKPKRLLVLDDSELTHLLLVMSNRHFGGQWSPRMENFNRWRPPGVSRANRQLTSRRLEASKYSWHDLVVQLTGREPKPLTKIAIEPKPVVPIKPTLLPYTPYWKREAHHIEMGLVGILAYRVIGEWCPTTMKYVAAYCERVLLLR